MSKKTRWFTICFALAVALDQATKMWAREVLRPSLRSISVIPEHFDLRYSENPGMAFSFLRDLSGARFLLVAACLIALVVIALVLRRSDGTRRLPAIGLGLIAGGAVGNLIDRVLSGRVTDFVVWRGFGHQWPSFNIADAALLVGVAALLLAGDRKPHVLSPAKAR